MADMAAWYGPYPDLSSAQKAAYNDYDGGLYAAFGYQEIARGRPRLLYVGVGDPLHTRLASNHHKLGNGQVRRITSIWLGVVESHKRPGRRAKKIEPLADAIEWAMIALLGPCLNERKKTFPRDSFAIVNRWWSCDPADRYEQPVPRPALIWPDVIECAGEHAPAHLCWLDNKKVRRIARPRFAKL
jgi:hypothetical protein